MRVMFFQLNHDAEKAVGEPPSPLTEELLDRLSHDFLDIDNRAKKAAKSEEVRLRSWQLWVTLGAAIFTGGLALSYQIYTSDKDLAGKMAKIEGRVSAIGGSLDVVSLEEQKRLVRQLDDHIRALENNSRSTPPAAR
jgi:hypothetical protein